MDYFDLQMLAGAALGLTEEQTEAIINDDEDFDSLLIEKFGIGFEEFGEVAKALLPLTPTVGSELSGRVYHAFVRQFGNGDCVAIVKQAIRLND